MTERRRKRKQSGRRLCGAVVLLCVFLQMLAGGTQARAEAAMNLSFRSRRFSGPKAACGMRRKRA